PRRLPDKHAMLYSAVSPALTRPSRHSREAGILPALQAGMLMLWETIFSRRETLMRASALAFIAATRSAFAADSGERFTRDTPVNPRQRLLLKGGTIISMDPRIGDLLRGDILIEGTKISAVGPNLSAANAQVIHAANMILIPGLID